MFLNFYKKEIYLDHASATPIDKGVISVMDDIAKKYYENPSTLYKNGVLVKKILNNARNVVAKSIGAHDDEIIFTSNATESCNIAIIGSFYEFKKNYPDKIPHIITSNIEHSAVREAVSFCKSMGALVSEIQVEKNGIVSPLDIKKALTEETILVSIMYANNEIGTIQPIQEIAKIIRQYKKQKIDNKLSLYPLFHTDITQAIQYIKIDVKKLNVDMMSFNGSKIYGPRGVGVLFLKREIKISPVIHGGNQEKGIRPGTENIPAVVGLAKALSINENIREKESVRVLELRNFLMNEITKRFSNISINGDLENRLPNNIHLSVKGIESEVLVIELDAKGFAVSSQSACKSDVGEVSHVIRAIKGHIENDEGIIRITLGRQNTKKEIIQLLKALDDIFKKYNIF